MRGFYNAGSGDFDLQSFTDGITALGGGGQTGATQLKTMFNEVDTCALPGDSVQLPKAQPDRKSVV